ncbi:porin [Bradyrhizobium sp. BR 1432]
MKVCSLYGAGFYYIPGLHVHQIRRLSSC